LLLNGCKQVRVGRRWRTSGIVIVVARAQGQDETDGADSGETMSESVFHEGPHDSSPGLRTLRSEGASIRYRDSEPRGSDEYGVARANQESGYDGRRIAAPIIYRWRQPSSTGSHA
jgi:hypothetical protein